MSTETKTNLKLLQASTPFHDYFSTILDLDGDWSSGMLEASDQIEPSPIGLGVWEGSCVITSEEEQDEDGDISTHSTYKFDGQWRLPNRTELDRLGEGRHPFKGDEFPDEACIVIA